MLRNGLVNVGRACRGRGARLNHGSLFARLHLGLAQHGVHFFRSGARLPAGMCVHIHRILNGLAGVFARSGEDRCCSKFGARQVHGQTISKLR